MGDRYRRFGSWQTGMLVFIRFLGWISLVLLIINSMLYVIRGIYFNWLETGSNTWHYFRQLNRDFERLHGWTGLLLVFTGLAHGWLALGGRLYYHTGLLVWLSVLVLCGTFIAGRLIPYLKIRRRWLIFHRYTFLAQLVFLVVHLISPGFI